MMNGRRKSEESMTVKIAIIGLGQTGASIGLALAGHKDQVTTIGYDIAGEVNRKAVKMSAVEKIGHGLYASVKEADMVILALPLDQIHATMQAMAQDVREEAVVLDTGPVKLAAAAWAEEYLPPKRHYVGLSITLNPLLLDETGAGVDSARADLFQNGLAAITAPQGTSGEAIKLAASFVTLLGARAYFADLAEVDGIMATIHTLPALAGAALMETVIGQPGWSDIRKLAGHPFMAGTHQLDGEGAAALAEATLRNRVNTVRVLNEYIIALQSLRDEIEKEEKDSLKKRLKLVLNESAEWRRLRGEGDWRSSEFSKQEIPTFNDIWKGQLGLGKLLGRRNKKTEDD
jgi:prephenate dehydrogenase